jgi:hypothetical protein
MWAHREPAIPLTDALSSNECPGAIRQVGMISLECCWEAVQPLTAIIESLRAVPNNQVPPNDGMLCDASDLLRLTS